MPRRIKQGGTKMPWKDKEKQSMTSDEAYKMKVGGLSEKQKKIAAKAPPPDKITGADFAVLKKEKAKGRGMGLQDEEIKPGKVMKAKTGKQIVKEFSASLKGIDESFKSKTHPMKKQRLMDRSTVVKARVGKSIDKKAYMKTIGVFPKVSGAPKNLNKSFMKTVGVLPTIDKVPPTVKGNQLGGGKLKALGRVMGSRAALLGALGATAVAGLNMAGKKLKEFADKKKDKKMAGGMAKKYSTGAMAEDRALEGKKAAYRKMGLSKMMDSGEIDFGDKHPLLKAKKEKQKKYENPMREERFQRTRQSALAKVVGQDNVSDPRKSVKNYSVGGGADMAKKYPRSKKYITLPEVKQHRRDVYKSMVRYSVGGGADTGAAGERRSKRYVLLDKMKRIRAGDTKTYTDMPSKKSRSPQNLISNEGMRIRDKRLATNFGDLLKGSPAKGYKSGVMVKVKLGRNKPTKMY